MRWVTLVTFSNCGLVSTNGLAKDTSPVPQLFGSSKPSTYIAMPPPQDRYEVNLKLVTVAGTEYAMQANLSHCEDVAELEDDILCFLPAV